MERDAPGTLAPLPLRAWGAYRQRGLGYVWHKSMRRALRRWPGLKRRVVYADPRRYWSLRGGTDYFGEQEGHPTRAARAAWLAERIAALRPVSILEIGCGYGKQLAALRAHYDGPLVGLDYSPTQLRQARQYLGEGIGDVVLVQGSGAELPFPDGCFDLVFTSAVILHNPPDVAERMRLEAVRVARSWVAHNEDTDVSYNRYGYDTAAWYRARGIPLAACGPIPVGSEAEARASQFCVADVRRPA